MSQIFCEHLDKYLKRGMHRIYLGKEHGTDKNRVVELCSLCWGNIVAEVIQETVSKALSQAVRQNAMMLKTSKLAGRLVTILDTCHLCHSRSRDCRCWDGL